MLYESNSSLQFLVVPDEAAATGRVCRHLSHQKFLEDTAPCHLAYDNAGHKEEQERMRLRNK